MEMATQLKNLRVVLSSGILVSGIWTFMVYPMLFSLLLM